MKKTNLSRWASTRLNRGDNRLGDMLEVLKHFKNYFSGNLAAKALGFLSIPILTRLLSTHDYGIYQVFSSYLGLFIILLTLNFHGSIARYYYDEPPDFDAFVGTSLVGSLLLLCIPSLAIVLLPMQIAEFLSIPESLLFYLPPLIILGVLYTVFDHICIASKESALYTKLNVSKAYTGLGAGILFVFLIPGVTYLGLIWGRLAASIFFAAYTFRWIRKQMRWRPKIAHLRFIASYSIPLVPYTLSNIILGHFDRIMINSMLGASEAGLYSLAYNVGLIMSMVTSSFQTALTPDWFRLMKNESYLRIDALLSRIFKFTLIAALGLILFSQEILILLADSRFHVALPAIPIVVIGYIFDAMFKIYGRSIGYTNKMIYITLIGVTAGAINVGLNIVFIPQYGYIAGAYTTVVSFAVMFGLAWWVAKYHLRQRVTPLWVLWKPLGPFVIGVVLYYLLLMMNLPFLWSIGLKLLVLATFCFCLFAMTKFAATNVTRFTKK